MKTKNRIEYAAAPYGVIAVIPEGTPVRPACHFPITLIGDAGHAKAQAETVRRLTTRPAWKLSDCTRTA